MREWGGVWLVGGWQATASLCLYAVFAATAFVREGFGLSWFLTGLAVAAVMVGYTLALSGAGAAVDADGERPAMLGGLGLLAVGMVSVAGAPTYPLVLAALVLVGVAYATGMPATNRAVLAVAPSGRRNLAMNLKRVGVTVGSGLSALFVTGAAARGDWRDGFLVAAGVAVVVAGAFARGYDGRPGGNGLSLPDVRGLLAGGGYRGLPVAGFFLGASVFTTTGYVVLYMRDAAGAAAGLAGATLAAMQVSGSVGRVGGGAFADRVSLPASTANARVLAGQAALAAACFVAVTLVGPPLPAAVAFFALGLFILGFPGVFYGGLTALVDDEEVGAATAGGQFALNAGGPLAPPAFGYAADAVGYRLGWYALAAFALAAGAAVLPLARG